VLSRVAADRHAEHIQAGVKQGVRVPIVTQAQLGRPPTVTYIDAFLRLTVTPQITSENTIFPECRRGKHPRRTVAQEVQGNPELITQRPPLRFWLQTAHRRDWRRHPDTELDRSRSGASAGNIPFLGNPVQAHDVNTNQPGINLLHQRRESFRRKSRQT